MRTVRRAPRRRPRLPPDPASLITASCGVPPGVGPRTTRVRTSGAESGRLGVLRRGRFTRPGTFSRPRVRSARAGTLRSDRGHSARAGAGILSPTASNAPGRDGTHPAAQDATGREAVSPPGATRTRSCVPDGAERPCGLCRPGSRTYLSIEDCVLLQKVTARAQSFGGEVRPGRRTQSPMGRGCRAAPSGWDRLPVPGCSGIGFAPWLQDDASTPTPAPRPCASGPRSRARPTTNRPELGAVPTPSVLPTGPPDVG